jgi:hypothetical protein
MPPRRSSVKWKKLLFVVSSVTASPFSLLTEVGSREGVRRGDSKSESRQQSHEEEGSTLHFPVEQERSIGRC